MDKRIGTYLVIEIGNTLSKIAIFADNTLLAVEKHETLTDSILEEFTQEYGIDQAIVSNVTNAPAGFSLFKEQGVPLLHFTSKTPIPIENCYQTPDTLGADRLALAVAANSLYPNQNVLAIDCGTALTFDFVNCKNQYLGGAISPGISTRFKALNHFTAKLPLVQFNNDYPLIGTDTTNCILSGVLNGIINEVDGYIDAIRRTYSDVKVVFTGGESFFFDKKLKNTIFVDSNLLLFGLNRILTHNVSQ